MGFIAAKPAALTLDDLGFRRSLLYGRLRIRKLREEHLNGIAPKDRLLSLAGLMLPRSGFSNAGGVRSTARTSTVRIQLVSASISERPADLLVPDYRARMSHLRTLIAEIAGE